jgi:YHS domain-containing protein
MNIFTRSAISTFVIACAYFSDMEAFAADEHNVGPGLTYVGAPLSLRGSDPVAFIDVKNRISGISNHVVEHDGVAYYFATGENLKTFKENPAVYVPQFGGFCAYGVSVGKKFDGDPSYAAVIDKKLYLFLNEGVYREFLKDKTGTIKVANTQWKKIKHTAAVDL